jgi:Apea-like HEPN
MDPFARAVRKSSGLNIESGGLALGRSRESDGLARLKAPRDIAIDSAVPRMFHPDAAKRFNELGEKIRNSVRVVEKPPANPPTSYSPYPAGKVKPEDVIGRIEITDLIVDGLGNEVGRLWTLRGESIGLVDDAYQEVKTVAKALEKTSSLRGRVQIEFLVDEICLWIQATLEGSAEPLVSHISTRCKSVIQEHEIWVPLFNVHGLQEFPIGPVMFRNISPTMMERFFAHPERPLSDAARQQLDRLRSRLQGHLAACVTLTAEKKTAQANARAMAQEAIALLRFLSPANWVLDMQSYCLPLGRERIEIPVELFVRSGEIREISQAALEHGPVFWDVDQERVRFPGLLDLLHALSSNHTSDFRRQLFDALLLYSRNSTASDLADKLVFVLVSLESMLLKDSNEPITKNIGERMAFLIGQSVDERKAIIQNVDVAYRIRSKFIHHGNSIEDSEVIEHFFEYAWQCFRAMLHQIVASKTALLEALENRKLS